VCRSDVHPASAAPPDLLRRRRLRFAGVAVATIFVASCARIPALKELNDLQTEAWTGRISLKVQDEPPQSFSGGFALRGQASRGDLTLLSPLGTVVGILRWSPGHAELDSGNGKVRYFGSVDELTREATGSAIPLEALFSWLQGRPANLGGWTADLSRHAEGRIVAQRLRPAPQAELRVLMER